MIISYEKTRDGYVRRINGDESKPVAVGMMPKQARRAFQSGARSAIYYSVKSSFSDTGEESGVSIA